MNATTDFLPATGLLAELELLRIEHAAAVTHLRLNRPAKRNAINEDLMRQLHTAVLNLPASTTALVISGEGDHFCSGLDLSDLCERSVAEGVLHSRGWHVVMDAIQFCRAPVVVALHGAVVGGGLELAAAAHIRVADETAYFGLPEGQRGIFVGGGGSVRIARLIGPDRLTEMMLTGRVYSGTEGERLGLVHYAVPQGQAVAKAFELAERIAKNSRTINTMVMQAIANIGTMPPEAGLYAESLAAALSQTGPDAAEGLSAFLEKRSPEFK